MAAFFKQGIYNEKEAVKIRNTFDRLPLFNSENAQCFFDIEIGEGEDK